MRRGAGERDGSLKAAWARGLHPDEGIRARMKDECRVVAEQAARASWPYWRRYLTDVMGQMVLVPIQLPAAPPENLSELASAEFDATLVRIEEKRKKKAAI